MHTDESSEGVTTLQGWCASIKPGEHVVRIHNGPSFLYLGHRDSSVQWCLPPGSAGLLAAKPGLQVLEGSARLLPVSRMSLVKLQFFIDQGVSSNSQSAPEQPWAWLGNGCLFQATGAALDFWYLSLALREGRDYQAFARLLRQGESYQLLGFLLQEGVGSEKLQDLAGRYGVSVSHFRRLCQQALGGAAKPELREWRTARALLTLVEGSGSLTEIALEHGYASSSHFSKEVRELVGVAPSSLIDITRLSDDSVDDV